MHRKNWFPTRPITNSWTLDAAAFIEIARKGFAAVPDFSSTIHVAIGRSLKAVLPDLGGLPEPATFSASMQGYIALSRALDADGALIARPFAPTLFQQWPQHFATLLLAELQGKKTSLFLQESLLRRKNRNSSTPCGNVGLAGRQSQQRNS